MRMSCNGCRVLRKGCSDDCSIRPCLQWIQSPESQANATVFLAKFYGRAGLMNLINVGPEHLRPALFRSLLYEACGRIVNPIYGSVGLLWSGRWQLCQNAVEAVLNGSPIVQIASNAEETSNAPPLKAFDIRHISKDENSGGFSDLHRIRNRCRFKRSGSKTKTKSNTKMITKTKTNQDLVGSCDDEESGHDEVVNNRSPSHESTLSHQSEAAAHVVEGDSHESPETTEGSAGAPIKTEMDENIDKIELELTLGFEPVNNSRHRSSEKAGIVAGGSNNSGDGDYRTELGLDYPVQLDGMW